MRSWSSRSITGSAPGPGTGACSTGARQRRVAAAAAAVRPVAAGAEVGTAAVPGRGSVPDGTRTVITVLPLLVARPTLRAAPPVASVFAGSSRCSPRAIAGLADRRRGSSGRAERFPLRRRRALASGRRERRAGRGGRQALARRSSTSSASAVTSTRSTSSSAMPTCCSTRSSRGCRRQGTRTWPSRCRTSCSAPTCWRAVGRSRSSRSSTTATTRRSRRSRSGSATRRWTGRRHVYEAELKQARRTRGPDRAMRRRRHIWAVGDLSHPARLLRSSLSISAPPATRITP